MTHRSPVSRRAIITLAPKQTPAPRTHIASLLVQAKPGSLTAVRELIATWPDAEVFETADTHKVAIVLEAGDDRTIGNATSEIQALCGVLSVSVVAHLTEDEDELRRERRGG